MGDHHPTFRTELHDPTGDAITPQSHSIIIFIRADDARQARWIILFSEWARTNKPWKNSGFGLGTAGGAWMDEWAGRNSSHSKIPEHSLTLTPTPGSTARRPVAAAVGSRLAIDHPTGGRQPDQTFDVRALARGATNRLCRSATRTGVDENLERLMAGTATILEQWHTTPDLPMTCHFRRFL